MKKVLKDNLLEKRRAQQNHSGVVEVKKKKKRGTKVGPAAPEWAKASEIKKQGQHELQS